MITTTKLNNNLPRSKAEGTGARGLVHALGGGEANQDLNDMEDDINESELRLRSVEWDALSPEFCGILIGINISDLTIEQYLRLISENQIPSMVKKVDDITINEYMEYEERMKRQCSRKISSEEDLTEWLNVELEKHMNMEDEKNKDTRNYDTIDPHNEIARQSNLLLEKEGLTKRWHVCKPIQVFYDDISGKDCGMWPTCDTDLNLCYGYNEVFGKNKPGTLRQWVCFRDHERPTVKGSCMGFAYFLQIHYRNQRIDDTTREQRYYEWVAQNYEFVNNRTPSTTTVSDKCSYKTKYPTPIPLNEWDSRARFKTMIKKELDEFLALGWHSEEEHVTWAHLEKKQTRLRHYTKNHEELCTPSLETGLHP
ncbi:hypothetical protein Tco_0518230 [Tanacetum coccineum]